MKKILFICCFFVVGFLGFAVEKLENVVPDGYLEQLKKDGKIELIHDKNDFDFSLVPKCQYADDVVKGKLVKTAKQLSFLAEYLYLVPKNDGDDSVVPGVKGTIEDMSVLCRSISKMTGMKYHFEKKKPETLYHEAFMISDLSSKKPIPDPIEGSADGMVAYCLQDDNSFGKMKYMISYFQDESAVWTCLKLATPMTVLGMKVVDENNMKVHIVVVECEDSYVLYLGTDVAGRKLPGARKQIQESMIVRIEAIYRWILDSI